MAGAACGARWASALAFAFTLLSLCALATVRVQLEAHSLGAACSALRQLPPLPLPPPAAPGALVGAAGVHISAWLVEGDPARAALPWEPQAGLVPGLRALAARAWGAVDVTLAPPQRLAYGSLADPSLLLPLHAAAAPGAAAPTLAFLIPAWAAPALRGLNADWPLAAGASEARTAYPLPLAGTAAGSSASGVTLASSCAPALPEGEERAAEDAGASLGRSLPAALAAAARALHSALSSATGAALPPAAPCAPYNRLLCHNALPFCATHRGGEHVHLVLFRPPAALSPLLYQAADSDAEPGQAAAHPAPTWFCEGDAHDALPSNNSSGSASGYCALGTPLRYFPGFGFVHTLAQALGSETAHSEWNETAVTADLLAALESALYPADGAAAWAHAHHAATMRILNHACTEWEGAGGDDWRRAWLLDSGMEGLKRHMPAHVVAELEHAVAELARAAEAEAEAGQGGRASAGAEAALFHLKAARTHATAAAQDALATLDGHTAPHHLLAIYAPWWAPMVLPLLLALTQPLREQCAPRKAVPVKATPVG